MSTAEQRFGDDPVSVRESGHYTEEYVGGLVDKWDDYIDWDSRAKSEGEFFIQLLREHGCQRILDVATGTGFHSVRLIEEGFEVVSCDGSPEMLHKAFDNGRARGHIMRTVQSDWRWLNRDIHCHYDAIVCLGNSFTHLFDENDRRKALAEFYATLKHDGLLILDQRNYDAIIDHGYSSSHQYYYCGEDISARPEHVDEGLVRFRYEFPDDSTYHLNFFPLRKAYMRRLMYEVGFQHVETYGDFQETYHEEQPDFFIHVAEKAYVEDGAREPLGRESADDVATQAIETAREYYNSDDADNFYATIWGGEDIHVGLYEGPEEPIADASRRTVDRMMELAAPIGAETRVLDIGSGYGGSARRLAEKHGCRCVALNLSERENERARELNSAAGLSAKVEVIDGAFENLPFEDESFDVIWSQDAFLHSGDRRRVLAEAVRVLAPGGRFVFTDPMRADDCPAGVLDPILERLHLTDLGAPGFYREVLGELGLELVTFEDHGHQLPRHYGRVREELLGRREELAGKVSDAYVERMARGLGHWVEGGEAGHLAWGIFVFRKP